jgi:hypothetical protein
VYDPKHVHASRENALDSIKQSRTESPGDFRRKFDAAEASMRHSGVVAVNMPDDEAQAVSYSNALDRSRFGQFLVD